MPLAHAQTTNPIAERMANERIAVEENNFRLQMAQITPDAHRARLTAIQNEQRLIQTLLQPLPKNLQTQIGQQAESLFQTRIVPLRAQWRQALLDKQAQDRAADQARRTELAADAQVAAKLQGSRIVLAERAARGELSRTELNRADRDAEQQILGLQRKYDAFGVAWGRLFTQSVQRATPAATKELQLADRLADTTSPVGVDAHRAAELTLAMQRNQLFRTQRAITPAEEQARNAALQTELTSINARYGNGVAAAADYRERVSRLVQSGAAEQRPQWESDAAAALAELEAQAAKQRMSAKLAEDERAAAARAAQAAAATASAASPPQSRRVPQAASSPTPPPPSVALSSPRLPDATFGGPPLALLIAAGAGVAAGIGLLTYRRRRRLAPPRYSDAQNAMPALPPEPSAQARSAAPSTSTPPAGTRKEQLFVVQRDKYRARYSDAADELTAATTTLTAMGPLLSAIQANLKRLSTSLERRLDSRLKSQYGGVLRLLWSAALLVPVWRFIKRSGWLLRIVAVVILWQMLGWALDGLITQQFSTVAGGYLAFVTVLFVFEWYTRRKAPLAEIAKSLDEARNVKLAYVYGGQLADSRSGSPVFHALRVGSQAKVAEAERFTVPASADTPPGSFLLGIGSLSAFRLEADGTPNLVAADTTNALVQRHPQLLAEALDHPAGFAAATLPALESYAKAAQRKDRLAAEVPRLEKLIAGVEHLERVWRDTYVSDDVFEFLFRCIDMFNMGDAATPGGLLLFGAPGNGKKHLARKIAESVGAKFEQVNPSKLAAVEDIAEVWKGARGAGRPVVLFIPNADAVFPHEEGGRGREHVLEWIAEWEKNDPASSRIWPVFTAKSDEDVDEAILDHVGRDAKIEITPPDAEGRKLVLRLACAEHQIPGALPDSVATLLNGSSVQDLIRITKAVKRASAPHAPTEAQWSAAVQAVRGTDAKLKDPTKTWDNLVLPPAIKERLKAACRILQEADEYIKGGAEIPTFLLHGPPGTGKTEIGRTIANEAGMSFTYAKLANLKGNHLGDSVKKVHDLFATARAAAPTVLFMDELDGAAANRASGDIDKYQQEMVGQLLAEMEGVGNTRQHLMIIGATNYVEHIDSAILERFSDHIEIPVPDEDGRREIVRRTLKKRALDPSLDVDETAALIARETPGRSGRALIKLVDRAVRRATVATSATGSARGFRLTRQNVEDELAELKRSLGEAVEEASWDTLVVGEHALAQLKEIADAMRNAEARLKQGVDLPRGGVLFGPPGTGKTQIARTLARESGVNVLLKGQSDLKSGFSTGTAQRVKQIFDEARSKAPCILFIDELDACAATRTGDGNSAVNDELVTELIVQMDGAKASKRPVFMLGATNYLERIDPAVRSRLSYEIEVPNPGPEQRERLFAIFLRKCRNVDFEVPAMAAELAELADDMSGRAIRALVGRAAQEAAARAERDGEGDRIVLRREDLLRQLAPKVEPPSEESLDEIWRHIVLDPALKESLLERVRMFNRGDKAAPKGLLLHGPPGTGKTQVARLLAKSANCVFLEANPATLKGNHVGDGAKEVKTLWAKARAHGRAVIFVDECDAVLSRRGGTRTDAGIEEIVGAFLPLWDGVGSKAQILVVGATNHVDRLDHAIVSRFGTPIEIGMPGAAERLAILKLELEKLGRNIEVPAFVATSTVGFSGRKLAELAQNVCMAGERGGVSDDTWRELTGAAVKATSDAVTATATWDTLVLAEPTMKRLKRICQMLRHSEELERQGVDVPRALLLQGPPGTGKTQIARTLAIESGVGFVSAKLSDVKAGVVGGSGQLVRELFERARSTAPCILFLDELDAMAPDRAGNRGDQFTADIANELLPQMEGVTKATRIFVLGATNHPHLIDPALLSRFEERIDVPNPDLDQRRRMVEVFLGKRRVDFDVAAVAAEVAARTEGLSGRALDALVRRGSQAALDRALDAGTMHDIVMTRDDLLAQL